MLSESLALPESFTPDANDILGEAPGLCNCWVAAGLNSLGILNGPGIGMALARKLDRMGWRVFAGVHRTSPDELTRGASDRLTVMRVDVAEVRDPLQGTVVGVPPPVLVRVAVRGARARQDEEAAAGDEGLHLPDVATEVDVLGLQALDAVHLRHLQV